MTEIKVETIRSYLPIPPHMEATAAAQEFHLRMRPDLHRAVENVRRLELDRWIYGNSFVSPHGERIDPTTVAPAT